MNRPSFLGPHAGHKGSEHAEERKPRRLQMPRHTIQRTNEPKPARIVRRENRSLTRG